MKKGKLKLLLEQLNRESQGEFRELSDAHIKQLIMTGGLNKNNDACDNNSRCSNNGSCTGNGNCDGNSSCSQNLTC
jgi:hypothetical protein